MLVASLVGCTGDEVLSPVLVDPSDPRVIPRGTLELPTTVWAENPRSRLVEGVLQGYRLRAAAGGRVWLSIEAADCQELEAHFFGPPDAGVRRPAFTVRADGCAPAVIDHALTRDGEYLLIVGGDEGSYRMDARCIREPCALPEAIDWYASSLVEAGDETRLREVGEYLFQHVFRVSEGLGNGMAGPPPNLRAVHDGPFGGPDAQSCVGCHYVGGSHGAGSLAENIFQGGDGLHADTALERNAPALHGVGLREAIGAHITEQLQTQAAMLAKSAIAARSRREADLCVPSLASEVCFGKLSAEADGALDTSEVDGIDPDLVVRPFGWKGREATLRGFTLGGFRVHFGMQAGAPIASFCSEPPSSETWARFLVTWGDPVACGTGDPDHDGVSGEITQSQLDAIAFYLSELPAPERSDHPGSQLFHEIGCASCHHRGFAVDDGEVEVWSDFKRHDMGLGLADRRPFDNHPNPEIPPRFYVTPPLWHVASTAPYLHDGRAPGLRDAIAAHDGEASDSRDAFDASPKQDQDAIVAFLSSLGRVR